MPEIICRPNTEGKKIIYLTFDDGPIPETTPFILDTLKKYGVKAAFFCVGENVKKYPELYKRILDEGHIVGNHSFNHLNGWRTSIWEYITNVEKCAEVIQSNLFRPPYGRISRWQYNILRKRYKLIFWDVLTPDYNPNVSSDYCLEIVKKKTREGSILVFHDNIKAKNNLIKLLPDTLNFLFKERFEIHRVTSNIFKPTKRVEKTFK